MDIMDKSRQMEEEMDRFEAEIASQNLTPAVNTNISGGFAYPSDGTFLPPQIGSNPMMHSTYQAMPMHPPGLPMYNAMPHPTMNCYPLGVPVMHHPVYNQPKLDTRKTNMYSSSTVNHTDTSVKKTTNEASVQKIISAAPQMAGPNELAARAKEAAAAAEASKSKAMGDDDDVTRALLAAAAGVTYTRVQGRNGKEKVQANITKPPLTNVLVKPDVKIELDPIKTAQMVTLPPPILPPLYRSTQMQTEEKKKKKCLRMAAGVIWDDPKLADWDPNDFRIFCGDLGYEVTDDTLARAFSHYSSFQRARVVLDKRTSKSRGYGFVSFSNPDDFTRAMREMNGKYVGNRPIKLKKSEWRTRQLSTIRKREKEKKKLGLKK